MQTVLKEIEASINSRPLVYVGNDINSSITLTPSHFLTLNRNVCSPDIDQNEDDYTYKPTESTADALLKNWHKGQKLLSAFWKIWREEYLLSLRERTQVKLKYGRSQPRFGLEVGTVELIKDELPRGCWRMGKIVELVVSRDKQVRSAKVKLPSEKVLGRPVNLLYPLECSKIAGNTDSSLPLVTENKVNRPVRKAAEIAKEKCKVHLQ
jgi:hypothetical protein